MRSRSLPVAVVAFLVLVGCSGSSNDESAELGSLVVTGDSGAVSRVDPLTGAGEVLSDGAERGISVQPTPSNDGAALVWTDLDDDGEPVIVFHDGSARRIASPSAPFFYLWAPGDDRIAALGNDPDGGGVALLIVDVEEGTARRVDAASPYYISWADDGGALGAHIGGEALVTVSLDGERTAVAVETGRFQAPYWASDGRMLAVVTTQGATAVVPGRSLQTSMATLAFVDPGSGEVDELLDVDAAASFDVVPGDARVAVVDGVGGAGTTLGSLVVVEEGGEPVAVAEEVVLFEWSPDGSLLLFHTLHPDEGLIPHVWDGETTTDYPGFVPTAVFVTQYLPFWSQYNQTITQWAPDSSAFTYAVAAGDDVDEEAASVFVQPLDGDPRPLAEGDMVVWSP